MTCWVDIMLACEVFESYQSIVAPNESVFTRGIPGKGEKKSMPNMKVKVSVLGEKANFVAL